MGLKGEEIERILNTTHLIVFVGRRGDGRPIKFAVRKLDARFSKGIFLTNDENYSHLASAIAISMGFKYGCSLERVVSSVCSAFHDINTIDHITLFELV